MNKLGEDTISDSNLNNKTILQNLIMIFIFTHQLILLIHLDCFTKTRVLSFSNYMPSNENKIMVILTKYMRNI